MTVPRAILTALARAHPYLLPESSLLVDVNTMIAPPTGFTELRRALVVLESRTLVTSIQPDRQLGDTDVKWRITDLGRTEVS